MADFDFGDSGDGGFRRRRRDGSPDPFSDAARFPTLVQGDRQDLRRAGADLHAAALGGPNSVAARFNPLDKGSIFSRQFGGAADYLRDQQQRADPSNNFYNGGTQQSAEPEVSAMDRYAIDTGYNTPDQISQQQGMSATDRYALDTGFNRVPNDLRRRRPTNNGY